MTRLQKDAVKELCIVLAVAFAVGIWYALTRNLLQGLCWLGLMGFLVIPRMFPSFKPGPVMESEDFLSYRKYMRSYLVSFIITWAILQLVYFLTYRRTAYGATIIWILTFLFSILLLLIILRITKLKHKMPKYDERELLVEKLSFGVFWVVFALWGVAAGLLSLSGVWHLPSSTYAFQVMVAIWIVQTVRSISIIWQEKRMSHES